LKITRRQILILSILIVLSPIFGVLLANIVDFHEPLDIVAEALGLIDITENINWTPLLDYSIPGLPAWLGYIISGVVGVILVFCISLLVERLIKGGVGRRRM